MGITSVIKSCDLTAENTKIAKELSVKNPIVKVLNVKLSEIHKLNSIDADIITNIKNFWGYKPRVINTSKGFLNNLNYYVCVPKTYSQFGIILNDYHYYVDAYYVNDEYYKKIIENDYTIG